ncbi:hypothetical protein WJX72_004489 [[Myrmecia] bisecta]|uniref:Uncharacterized protein n=1 Tax=[Myrmecia] bisecta TaxID=41462 RepID=A0AAW1Q0Q6_9CHLO
MFRIYPKWGSAGAHAELKSLQAKLSLSCLGRLEHTSWAYSCTHNELPSTSNLEECREKSLDKRFCALAWIEFQDKFGKDATVHLLNTVGDFFHDG